MIPFNVEFNLLAQQIQAQFSYNNKTFQTQFDKVIIVNVREEPDYYDGDYTVTPKVEEQVLQTEQKFMDADVIIKEIPFYDVANNSGGITVFIGNDMPYTDVTTLGISKLGTTII